MGHVHVRVKITNPSDEWRAAAVEAVVDAAATFSVLPRGPGGRAGDQMGLGVDPASGHLRQVEALLY
jgi:hypothetical protein